MKKNTLLFIGIAAAAVLFLAMRRRRGSSVEAGSPIIQSDREFEADFEEVKPKQTVLDTVKNVLQTIKRSPEKKAAAEKKKAAAQKRKALRKDPKAAAAAKSFLNMPKIIKGFDNNIGLY
jgi:hypothetical protein